MANQVGLHLHQVIVHGVDHLKPQPELSDVESKLLGGADKFLKGHILNNRTHKNSRAGVFRKPVSGAINLSELCYQAIEDNTKFIDSSRAIAGHLFKVMEGNKSISQGDLVVCCYSEPGENDPRQLALLKMDPRAGYVGQRVILPGGRIQVEIREIDEVLPTGGLQKCAFVYPKGSRKDKVDLRVLDQQAAGYGHERMVASFFLKQFLQCRVDIDPEAQTETFYFRARQYAKKKLDEQVWDLDKYNRFITHSRAAIQAEQVNVTDFTEAQIEEHEEQTEFLEYMTEEEVGLRELTFKPGGKAKERLGQYTYFEGDNGIELRIHVDDIKEKMEAVHNKAKNIWTVTLETRKWEPLQKRS